MNIKNTARRNWRISGIVIIVLISLSFTSVTFASPIDDKKKKADELYNQIQSNGDKISALSESYNATTVKLSNLKADVEKSQIEIEAAELANQAISDRVQKRAISLYTASADSTEIKDAPLNNKRKDSYANLINGSDSNSMTQLQISQENLTEKKDQLKSELSDIEAQEKALASQKSTIEAANATQQALLNKTKGELSTLIAQRTAAAQAAATTRAVAATRPRSNSGSSNSNSGSSNSQLPTNLPAPSPRAAVAIEFARAQLGKPYQWGATGPGTFDCSGLTMRAWQAAGISIPRVSGDQFKAFPRITDYSQLQPGDLVFRGPGGSNHVGLYIGNGLMINAPQTGDVVKIAPIRSTSGAVRPG